MQLSRTAVWFERTVRQGAVRWRGPAGLERATVPAGGDVGVDLDLGGRSGRSRSTAGSRSSGVGADRPEFVRLFRSPTEFVAVVRSTPVQIDALRDGLRSFLNEDVVALGDIQKFFDSLQLDQRTIKISIAADAPGIRTRRMIEKRIADERKLTHEATAETATL